MLQCFVITAAKAFSEQALLVMQKAFACIACATTFLKLQGESFDDYGFGLGVFTMQGFEHCNKESKNVMRRRSNLKHNLTDQTIFCLCQHLKARIWDSDDKKKKKKRKRNDDEQESNDMWTLF